MDTNSTNIIELEDDPEDCKFCEHGVSNEWGFCEDCCKQFEAWHREHSLDFTEEKVS
jgi:hypothetical protein